VSKLKSASWPLTARDFENLTEAREPVIFRGAAADWPCTRLWSNDYLQQRWGTKSVTVTRSDTPLFKADPERGHYTPDQMQSMTFADFLQHTTASHGPPHFYLHRQSLDLHLPELRDEIVVPEQIRDFRTLIISLWMGPAGSITPIHHDFTDNFFVQVRGRKRVILFRPEPEAAFYRMPFRAGNGRPSWHISRVGSLESENREAFPRFETADVIDVVVEQGDLLYIPAFFWHEVHSLDSPSISLSYWWEERSLPEIDAAIAKITDLVALYASAPPSWKALIQRIMSEHVVGERKPSA
jgi:hypothetical protein